MQFFSVCFSFVFCSSGAFLLVRYIWWYKNSFVRCRAEDIAPFSLNPEPRINETVKIKIRFPFTSHPTNVWEKKCAASKEKIIENVMFLISRPLKLPCDWGWVFLFSHNDFWARFRENCKLQVMLHLLRWERTEVSITIVFDRETNHNSKLDRLSAFEVPKKSIHSVFSSAVEKAKP